MPDADDRTPVRRLRRVYDVEGPDDVRAYYDAWADGYDDELRENGYAAPQRVAAAVAAHVADRTAPVLDYGCGTGLSGAALRAAGFVMVDGADPSPAMLRVAAAKQIYRSLVQLDPHAAPPFAPSSYPVVTAVGVIGPGAAPMTLVEQLVEVVAPAGILGLSLNDVAVADPAARDALGALESSGRARVLVAERGPHLPGLEVHATVYVLERVR